MRLRFAIWASALVCLAVLMWLKAPTWCLIAVFVVCKAIDWSAKWWIRRQKAARGEPTSQEQSEPSEPVTNRRLITGAIGGSLGVVVGVSVGMFMQSDATTIEWLAILLGALGLMFGVAFK